LPSRTLVDSAVTLPQRTGDYFILGGSDWQVPDFDDAELFVERLVREDLLVREPVVRDALHAGFYDQPHLTSSLNLYIGQTPRTAPQRERAAAAVARRAGTRAWARPTRPSIVVAVFWSWSVVGVDGFEAVGEIGVGVGGE
jgi:hypothetical protein